MGIVSPINNRHPSDILKEVKERYKNATHYCYAYRKATGEEYFTDGGEPTGTAGIPILNALRERDLYDIIGIVIRYFGGIKLGIRGLIDAYHYTMEKTLEKSKITEKIITSDYVVRLSYKDFNAFKSEVLRHFRCEVKEKFEDNVIMEIKVPIFLKDDFEKFLFKRGVEIEKL
ncbi:IMPACT family protein [Dictyoglomus sp.]|uniref:IMPACT family protein n=1 Tax=Dictyoglomus sp. TaxID=28205 RepID=UPI003D117B3E